VLTYIFLFQKRNKLHPEEGCRFICHCCIGVHFNTNGDHADNHHTFTDWSSPDSSKRIHFAFFINLLRQNFCINVAYGLLQSYDAYVSLSRIQDFLRLDNLTSTTVTRKRLEQNENLPDLQKATKLEQDPVLLVESSTLREKDKDDGFSLQNVAAKKGSLIVITGPVGSGKSTLLSTIAGEGTTQNISITCRGFIIYVPQIPWLFSGTVRENVLFGEPYEESKYARIIEACALADDIQQFPEGNKAVVGERGVALSGGQRARVSLARAAYADADLYLLDDPLSALDSKVGLHIFTKCIKGLPGEGAGS